MPAHNPPGDGSATPGTESSTQPEQSAPPPSPSPEAASAPARPNPATAAGRLIPSARPPTAAEAEAIFDCWARPATHWLALLAVTGIIFYISWLILRPFVDVLMWATVLVIVFRPVHRRVMARVKSTNVAAAVSSILVIVTFLLPLTLLTIAVARDATRLAYAVQARKDQLLNPDPATPLGRVVQRIERYVDIDRVASQQYIAERISRFSGSVARGTLNIVGGFVGAIVQIFFVIFTMFFLFRDGPRLWAIVRDMLPLDRWQTREVVARTRDVIYASVYGSVIIALIQGTLGGLAFWVLGVPSPLLWGAVMTVLCMIPLAGSFLVWVPAAIYLFATGNVVKAIILAAWGTLVISTIDNLLRPRLVGRRTRMHELVIFFSVLGGLQVFGVLGIVAGPVIAAIAMALIEVWRRSSCAPAVASPPAATSGSAPTS